MTGLADPAPVMQTFLDIGYLGIQACAQICIQYSLDAKHMLERLCDSDDYYRHIHIEAFTETNIAELANVEVDDKQELYIATYESLQRYGILYLRGMNPVCT